jgi:8-oxo-dGTP pyrophosphatase MutT (NUDIX family)
MSDANDTAPTPGWLKPPSWLKPHGHNWRAGPAERVHENPYFAVDQYEVVAPTGVNAGYWVFKKRDLALGVVPLHADGTITLVGQWRFPFDCYSWELPEGGAPPGEPPLAGIQRELREEAGLIARNWTEILRMQLSNSSCDEVCHIFLATDFSPADTTPDPTESLAVERVSFGEALEAACSGQILDSVTVAALLRVHHMACMGELSPELAKAVLQSVAKARGG